VSKNVVGERNRTSLGHQPFGSFSVHTLATAQNTEVGSGQDNQRDFVGSQMYVNCIICIIINFDNTIFPYRRRILTQLPVICRYNVYYIDNIYKYIFTIEISCPSFKVILFLHTNIQSLYCLIG